MIRTPDRLYSMRRLATGDYLWPADDGITYYRIRRYLEDGSASRYDGTTWRPITGHFWSVERFAGPPYRLAESLVPGAEWYGEGWMGVEYGLKTRAAALEAALRDSELRAG